MLRMLGNGRLEAQCIDGVKRLCHIRGKDEKKSVGEHLGYHPTRLERFSRRKSRRDSEVHGRRGKKFKGIRRTSESIRVNETDTFEEERDENDDFFDFDDIADI